MSEGGFHDEQINDHNGPLHSPQAALDGIGIALCSFFLSVAGKADAASGDADRPILWIEIGRPIGAIRVDRGSVCAALPVNNATSGFETTYPVDVERPPRFAIGENAKLTFEPAGTDWVFSAVCRYGRSSDNKIAHQQMTLYPTIDFGFVVDVPFKDNYATTKVKHGEKHGT